MNKEQLVRLQQKVNRLMRTSSEESDQENIVDFNTFNPKINPVTQTQPETVRKCIDLIKQNKQLKLALQKQRGKNDQLRKQIQKQRKQKQRERQDNQRKSKKEQKINFIELQKVKKTGKLQAELEQSLKRNKILQQMLINQRKKNKKLCLFINKNLPEMQNSIDKLTTKIDTKLQAHFSRLTDI